MEFNIFCFLISKIFKFIVIYFITDLNFKNFILEIYLFIYYKVTLDIDYDKNKTIFVLVIILFWYYIIYIFYFYFIYNLKYDTEITGHLFIRSENS